MPVPHTGGIEIGLVGHVGNDTFFYTKVDIDGVEIFAVNMVTFCFVILFCIHLLFNDSSIITLKCISVSKRPTSCTLTDSLLNIEQGDYVIW